MKEIDTDYRIPLDDLSANQIMSVAMVVAELLQDLYWVCCRIAFLEQSSLLSERDVVIATPFGEGLITLPVRPEPFWILDDENVDMGIIQGVWRHKLINFVKSGSIPPMRIFELTHSPKALYALLQILDQRV